VHHEKAGATKVVDESEDGCADGLRGLAEGCLGGEVLNILLRNLGSIDKRKESSLPVEIVVQTLCGKCSRGPHVDVRHSDIDAKARPEGYDWVKGSAWRVGEEVGWRGWRSFAPETRYNVEAPV
jgi:hypothetical protein